MGTTEGTAQRCEHRTGCWPRTPVQCHRSATHAISMPYGLYGYTDGFGCEEEINAH